MNGQQVVGEGKYGANAASAVSYELVVSVNRGVRGHVDNTHAGVQKTCGR
jgi:hypothetical protein